LRDCPPRNYGIAGSDCILHNSLIDHEGVNQVIGEPLKKPK
jgi:hypothetical protein